MLLCVKKGRQKSAYQLYIAWYMAKLQNIYW